MLFPLIDLDRKLGALFPGRSYANGGRVRDHFINEFHGTNLVSKDYDYVLTGTTVAEAEEKLRTLGPVTLAGACFPVFKVTIGEETLDVALARTERSTGVGHRDFDVDFGIEVSVEEDQRRRDFTMNALSVDCSTGIVSGSPSSLHDIEMGIIRAANEHTILEDPLRILRAIQFAARFDFVIDNTTFGWLYDHAALVGTVSPERIAEELNKLLVRSSNPSRGIRIMRETRTLPFIFAELGEGVGCVQNQHHVHDVFNHNLAALEACASHGGDLVDRFSALLHDVGKPRTAAPRPDGNGNTFYGHDDLGAVMVKDILGRLRYGNELIGDVSSLVGLHMYATCGSDGTAVSDASVRRFIQNCTRGTDDRALARARVERQFLLRACDRIGSGRDLSVRQGENDAFEDRVRAEMAKNVPVTTAALVVDGRDIIAAAIAAGVRKTGYRGDRLVGETLGRLLEIVIDQPKLNERSRLLAAADEILAQQRPDIQNTLTP